MGWNSRKLSAKVGSPLGDGVLLNSAVAVELEWPSLTELKYQEQPLKFSKLIGLGVHSNVSILDVAGVSELKNWLSSRNDLVLGYFSYDLKNSLESLTSNNPDAIGFSKAHFFVPEQVFLLTEAGWVNLHHGRMEAGNREPFKYSLGRELKAVSEKDYIHQVENLQQHIQFGDIYEVNYCVQHGFENTVVEPYRLYQELQQNSPAPFSCFVADNGKYLMSSSPERFMRKEGKRVISQPMKGTNRRTSENEKQKQELRNNAKEVAENVMITDLVRNDLSRSAKKGTVKVDELCGVYEFEHVNTMISTVSAELQEDVHPLDALLNAFPMGSMTGAPKIRAMELIDQFEDFSRGLYSGAVGYFTPDLDFDFNVIIRSILYNEEKQIVTFPTGGAITINSDPEKEYEECMLKAEAMRNVLLNHAK